MDEDKDILEGFNAGYLIEKHRPELSKQLVMAVKGVEMPFVEGFVAGTQEYANERGKNKVMAKLKEASKSYISRPTKEKGKDHDDIEIDKY